MQHFYLIHKRANEIYKLKSTPSLPSAQVDKIQKVYFAAPDYFGLKFKT